jgi:hypothetical protein
MISLDPEFVGSLAPPSKLTTVTTIDGKPPVAIPFARLPRLERLRASGKADETEVDNEGDGDDDDPNGKKHSREEREKRKMRGKGKSLKRFTLVYCLVSYNLLTLTIDTCGNSGKTLLILLRYVYFFSVNHSGIDS